MQVKSKKLSEEGKNQNTTSNKAVRAKASIKQVK